MKLTKQEIKRQQELINTINTKDKLTFEEIDTFYKEFNEGWLQDVTATCLYCTPVELAYDITLLSHFNSGVIVDVCAGLGVLTHAYATRCDYYNSNWENKIKFICIEKNSKLVELGKKLCPYAVWIEGDCFDPNIWNIIENDYGNITHIISNPPYNSMVKLTKEHKKELKYKGSKFQFALLEVCLHYTNNITFVVPETDCEFTTNPYYQRRKNKDHDNLRKLTGINYHIEALSLEIRCYPEFKNTKIPVNIYDVTLE